MSDHPTMTNKSQIAQPEPQNLTYRPVAVPNLLKPVFVLRSDGEDFMVDLRSVSEAIGVAWGRWNLLLKAWITAWKLEGCIDRKQRETLLIPQASFVRFMGNVHQLIEAHSKNAALRAKTLRTLWPRQWVQALESEFADAPWRKVAPPGATQLVRKGRKRTATAENIFALYERTNNGEPIAAVASALGMATSTAKEIIAGRNIPKTAPFDVRLAWEETFGRAGRPKLPKLKA